MGNKKEVLDVKIWNVEKEEDKTIYLKNVTWCFQTNDIAECFMSDVPEDGEHPFEIQQGIYNNPHLKGTMIIGERRIDLDHFDNQLSREKMGDHTFIERLYIKKDGTIIFAVGS